MEACSVRFVQSSLPPLGLDQILGSSDAEESIYSMQHASFMQLARHMICDRPQLRDIRSRLSEQPCYHKISMYHWPPIGADDHEVSRSRSAFRNRCRTSICQLFGNLIEACLPRRRTTVSSSISLAQQRSYFPFQYRCHLDSWLLP